VTTKLSTEYGGRNVVAYMPGRTVNVARMGELRNIFSLENLKRGEYRRRRIIKKYILNKVSVLYCIQLAQDRMQ
jgi:hypothetical protein